MPDLSPRLPCPVCLGVTMERASVGPGGSLEIDHCGRCGGFWLEEGEVQRLRSLPRNALWKQVDPSSLELRMRCHDCHAPLDRSLEACPTCGWANVLDCPGCDRPMRVEEHAGLRLDVCRDCRGVWFDHHELKEVWGASFDRALQRRRIGRDGVVPAAGDAAGDVLLHSLFWAPDLLFLGGHAAVQGASAATGAVASLPGALASAPEAASGVMEALAEAASSVFEVTVEIISGIFEGF